MTTTHHADNTPAHTGPRAHPHPTTPASLLTTLFAFKAWAGREMFAGLAAVQHELPPAELRTAIRTLNHIHVVDRIFQAHLQGRPHGYSGTNTNETPTLQALRDATAECDAWYEDYVATLTDEQRSETLRFTFTDGDAGAMTREEILLHVATHGGYHRGNVGQIFKSAGKAPPRELLTKFLHEREAGRRGGE